MQRIRVLVVDDSALIRQLLTRMLGEAHDIEVVGTASDPYAARDKIKALSPDVITLDVEMPRMDGLTFLENLMRLRPMPVVMVSSLTQRGAEVTLQALELGAVDFVAKPQTDLAATFHAYANEIREKVRMAARSRVRPPAPLQAKPVSRLRGFTSSRRLFAIGASTGGTEALRQLLVTFPADTPPIVIAQHIPAAFSRPFAERIDKLSALNVLEAIDGAPLLDGHAYIAPGGRHLRVRRDGAHWVCRLGDDDPVNRHRPSVDVLFHSVAEAAGSAAVGALLTGMGDDGARGLLAMREAGAYTIAQDEATSVVWGMPGAAVRMGAAMAVVGLGHVAGAMLNGPRQ